MITPETRINVKPEYHVLINKGLMTLTARFSYSILGSKTEALKISLPDWTWNGEIKPAGIVDVGGVRRDENGILTLPLRTPMDGTLDLELKAACPIPAGESSKHRLTIPLPKPEAAWCEAAPVVIIPADNVELEARESAANSADTSAVTTGLTRQSKRSLPLHIELPAPLQQEPLFYRTNQAESVFVADIQYHQQKIMTASQTEINLRNQKIEQKISYKVSYVPADKLTFFIPQELEENGNIQVLLGGKPLELRDASATTQDIESSLRLGSRKVITLPDTLFKFQLVFRYSIPPIPMKRDLTTPFALSFIRPLDTESEGHQTEWIVPRGYQISLLEHTAETLWKAATPRQSDAGFAFQSEKPNDPAADNISLLIRTNDRDALGSTIINRAWVQTWLSETVRMDHATYQVNTNRDALTLQLPSEAVQEHVFVYVDKTYIKTATDANGTLTIPFSAKQQNRPVDVDILYRFPFNSSHFHHVLPLPHFDSQASEVLLQSGYWQLILPSSRHTIGIPSGWSAEYYWAWRHFFFGRVPSMQKTDFGFDDNFPEKNVVPSEANQYLYSSIQPSNSVELYLFDRSLLVLMSSAVALLLGLSLIYFPAVRYTGSLFALGVAFLAILFYRPAPVLLMLQAASFGIVLTMGAWYLYRIFYRNDPWIIPSGGSGNEQESEVFSVIIDESNKSKQPENAEETEIPAV
jgi:hypothetical protein